MQRFINHTFIMLVAVSLGLAMSCVLAEPNATVQQSLGRVTLAGKQVPLSARPWVIAGSATIPLPDAQVYNLILFDATATAVTGFVAIHANLTPAKGGWGISSDCQNQDGRFAHIYEHRSQHYFCVFVQAEGYQPDKFTAWEDAVRFANRNHWHLPAHWSVVGFRIADAADVIDIRYGFDPALLVAAGVGKPITDPKLANSATQALIRWQEAVRYLVERGFSNQIDNENPLPPLRLGIKGPSSTEINSRLQRLEALRAQGWLSETDFLAEQAAIAHPLHLDPDENVDIWRLGVAKTAVHTVQSTLWMFGVNYAFLGNLYLAGGLALAKGIFSPTRYYLHELAWNTWGPRGNAGPPVVDFSAQGVDKKPETEAKK